MKTARNSLKGYTYQNYIFTLLLSKMDAEREIVKIISEATDTKNFDDAYIELSSGNQYRLQAKNYKGVKLTDIQVDPTAHTVSIKTNKNEYDPTDNNIFVINADLKNKCDDEFLGIPAIKLGDILIVPLSEETVADMIEGLYQHENRALQIIQFGYKLTSAGKFEVAVSDLPSLITITTDLNQKTIFVRGVPEEFPCGVTHIEGKPGVGKSHYVNEITDTFPDSIIYRFWIGAQDSRLNARLRFDVFIEQIGLLSFQSPRSFTNEELIEQLCNLNKLIVIDGLDHVENYNPHELSRFIEFINKLGERSIRVVVLSRPIRTDLTWQKIDLSDWTYDETALYLASAHSITDYMTQRTIYEVSKGYPIITSFLAEHYLIYGELNIEKPIESIYDYYNDLISDVRTKSLLGVFSVNNSFFTKKELEGFFEPVMHCVIKEFIDGYPYLFEISANRISLVHDSFNTFIRQQEGTGEWAEKINQKVFDTILSGNIEYMARLSSFHFNDMQICSILKQYSDFDEFEKLMLGTVDYNSIAAFYEQLRRLLELRPNVLDIYQYYAFTLIFQIVIRNDLIGYEGLVFQILQYIHKDGDIENQIFSSDIIWQVYLACKDRPDSIKRYMENTMYGDGQLSSAYDSINEEIQFFDCLENKIDAQELLRKVDYIQNDSLKKSDMLQEYLVAVWIQQEVELPFFNEFNAFVESNNEDLIYFAIQSTYHFDKFWAERVYYAARYRLHELGFFGEKNICRQGSILSIINNKAPEGSFNVAPELLSYLRLANHEDRTVDICNINYVWSMYAQRKDYSVHTIDTALVTYEKEGLIEEEDSFDIIHRLMNQSEKGIRHLLASYIDLKGSEYVKRIVKSGKIFDNDLELDFFELDPENIDCLPVKTIEKRLAEMMRYHRRVDYIDGHEIRNPLKSKYGKIICDALDYLDKKVMDGLDEQDVYFLKEAGIEYICKDNKVSQEEYVPFRNGCICKEDFDYIRERNISFMECSRYADGWYTCLPYVDLYELFDLNEIKTHYLEIVHQALFARVVQNEHIGNWNDIIGNIPAFLEKYGIDADWKKLFYIMLRFLDLSVIYYPKSLMDNCSSYRSVGAEDGAQNER